MDKCEICRNACLNTTECTFGKEKFNVCDDCARGSVESSVVKSQSPKLNIPIFTTALLVILVLSVLMTMKTGCILMFPVTFASLATVCRFMVPMFEYDDDGRDDGSGMY